MDAQQRQLDREDRMIEMGRSRAEKAILRSIERGEAADTPAGRVLAKRAMEPLIEALKNFVVDGYDVPVKRANYSMIPKEVHLLRPIDPEMAAYTTIRATLNAASKQYSLKACALAIAEQLELELMAGRFEEANKNLHDAVVRRAKQRGLTGQRTANALKLAALKFNVTDPRMWTQHDRLQLGVKLVELMISTVGLVEVHLHKRGKTTSQRLCLTAEVMEWFGKYNQASTLTRPLFMPTVVPPQKWTSVDGGPYYSARMRQPSILSRGFPGQLDAMRSSDMSAVYKGLNGLQETAWAINTRVLDVMKMAWERDAGLPCLPPREDTPIPPVPPEVEADVKGGEIRKAWRLKIRAIHERNAIGRSSRFEFARALSIAEDNRDEPAIYFPHRLDFRGRAYAAATTLNPQGSDESKALLHFAEGKPLGERGLFWLGVHGANLFGNDKVSLEERYQWAIDNAYRASQVAADPLGELWWTEADKPWSFLAWCFEWGTIYALSTAGVPETEFCSRLPIALDGSCNGIQHFSAMLRDPIGGAAVNLVPSAKPNDIYGRVAERAVEKLREIAAEGGPDAWIADAWVRFGIDRKITKRSVMVLPYGGTFKSCMDYVREAVNDRLSAGAENPFGDALPKATALLAKQIWTSISDVVVAARQAMGWLQACARVCTAARIPVQWTTPTGFVVKQDYREVSGNRVKSRFFGGIIYFTSVEPTKTIDASKQASAVSPNFVHSMDASALMLTIGRCLDEGINAFAMIHDSYGTHAADTDKLAHILRETFVQMYLDHDVLAEFRDELLRQLPPEFASKVPPLPEKGELDLRSVLSSTYFFA